MKKLMMKEEGEHEMSAEQQHGCPGIHSGVAGLGWGFVMMLEKVKTNIVTILVCIAAILTIIEQLWKGRWGVKMILDLFPAKIETFWLLMTIFAMILLLVNYERIPLLGRKYKKHKKEVTTLKTSSENEKKTLQSELEDTRKHLGSELEEKEKQYNKLLSETSLPKPVEELIRIEKMREPSIHDYIKGEFPTLKFLLRVINYTYYSFEPKKVEIEYYCGGKKVGHNSELASPLPKCGDGSIDCRLLVEEIYSNIDSWRLKCSVVYALGNKEYVIKTDLNYTLSKSFHDKLKQRVVKALTKGEEARNK